MSEKLPSIKELVSDLDGYKKMDELNVLLNQEPPKKWIAQHPFIKTEKVIDGRKVRVPYEYLPIDKVEYLLRKIFKSYKIEVLRESTMFNAVTCTVRVWYKDLISGEWLYHDGVGASQLQTKKDTGPGDLSNINNGAVTMALPLAKTLAIKDACDMFGNLFGANLNRKDTINVSGVDDSLMDDDDLLKEINELKDKMSEEEVGVENWMYIKRIVDDKESDSYLKVLKLLRGVYAKRRA